MGQVNGECEAKDPSMIKYLSKVHELLVQLPSCRIQRIPRSANAQADHLAKLATSRTANLDALGHIEILKTPSIEEPLSALCATMEPSWMDPIVQYLKVGTLPIDTSAAHQIKRMAPHYTLVDEQLYKRSFTLPLLKCLLPSKAKYALQEVHDGLCGNHLGGRALAHKILR